MDSSVYLCPAVTNRPFKLALLFAFVILAWGLNWVVMKLVVQETTPLWAVTLRTLIAAAILLPAQGLLGQLILPRKSDWPVVLVISLLHMVAFAALMTMGLKYVPAGRAIVLGYTTPLWAAPCAWLFLKEPVRAGQMLGIALGLAGLLLLFDPSSIDWQDRRSILGNGLILLAALCWSLSIVYVRAHRWTATPFQLVSWQTLLASAVLAGLALAFEGPPIFVSSPKAILALLYNGAIGTALGFWAMTVVNRDLPATATALGVLGTPVVGLAFSALILDEAIDPALILSALMIVAGIAVGTIMRRAGPAD